MVTPSLPSTPSLPLTTTLSKLVTLLSKANLTVALSLLLDCSTVKFLPASMLTVLVCLMVFALVFEAGVVLPVDLISQVITPSLPFLPSLTIVVVVLPLPSLMVTV